MNFAWLEQDRVAACRGPRSMKDLEELRRVGIKAIIRLADNDEQMVSSVDVKSIGLEDLHLPVMDFRAPSQTQLDRAVEYIRQALASKCAVAVTCGAGIGRTSTVLACYLIATHRVSAREAIERLHSVCKRGPENTEQREAVYNFDRRHN